MLVIFSCFQIIASPNIIGTFYTAIRYRGRTYGFSSTWKLHTIDISI